MRLAGSLRRRRDLLPLHAGKPVPYLQKITNHQDWISRHPLPMWIRCLDPLDMSVSFLASLSTRSSMESLLH